MTKVGKIFVILNLVFSLVVGAFVLVVYMAQAHWAHENNELTTKLKAAEASNVAYQQERQKLVDYLAADAETAKLVGFSQDDKPEDKLGKIKTALTNSSNSIKQLEAAVKQKSDDLVAERDKTAKADAVVASSKAELEIRQKEVADTRDRLKKQSDDIAKMLKDLNTAKGESVDAKLQAKALLDRNLQLEKDKDSLARDLQRMVASGASLAAVKPKDLNPPAENVEGKIKEVGSSGLITITIGSDAGLAKNQTLEVYRLNEQSPEQSRYLGRIKIVEVGATEAVAQPVGKPVAPFQRGDDVGSHILGG
jgi:chromosome segregation ATPase